MRYLTLILALLMFGNTHAQFPVDLEIDEATTKQAFELTSAYDDALSFTPKQFLLIRNVLEKNLAKRKIAQSELEGREKLDAFYAIQQQQDQEMGEILTRIQFSKYKRVQDEIQPLARVKEEKDN